MNGSTSGSLRKSAFLLCQFSEENGRSPISSSLPSGPATLFIFIFFLPGPLDNMQIIVNRARTILHSQWDREGQSHCVPALSVILILAMSAPGFGGQVEGSC